MLDQKYMVFKAGSSLKGDPLPEDEFFVIRKQDVLSVTALWAYVNTLRTAVDTMKLLPKNDPYDYFDEIKRLEEWANEIAQLASLWENTDVDDKKLPD